MIAITYIYQLLCVALYDALSLLLLYLSNHYVANIIINCVDRLVVWVFEWENSMITYLCFCLLCMTNSY